jgi:hypothetical protein
MNKSKFKLIPVRGLVLLGLAGATYAQCYYENSSICVYSNWNVGYDPNTQITYYANGDWINPDYTTTPPGYPALNNHSSATQCYGPAYYYVGGIKYYYPGDYTDNNGHNYYYPTGGPCQ